MVNHHEHHRKKLDRLNTFVDGVLAIAITLLVLDLKVPILTDVHSTVEMMGRQSDLLSHFSAFFLCFLAIAQFWLSNNAYFSLIDKYDDTLAILVIVGVLPVCLLPFAASVIGEYPHNPGSFIIFGGLYLGVTVMASIIMRFCWRNEMFSENVHTKLIERRILKVWWVGPGIVILIIGASFLSTTIALLLFVTLLIIWLYMTRQLKLLGEADGNS